MRLLYSRSFCLQVPQAETCPIRWTFLTCGIWKTLLDKQTGSKEGPKHLKTPNLELILFYTWIKKHIYIYIHKLYTLGSEAELYKPEATDQPSQHLDPAWLTGWLADFCVSSWSFFVEIKSWSVDAPISFRDEKYNRIWQTVLWSRCYFRWPFVPSV